MGKKLSNHERACVLSKEILDGFADDKKLSLLLQKASQLASFTGDADGKRWIDKEIVGDFDFRSLDDYSTALAHKRVYIKGNNITDPVDTLEEEIKTLKTRLSAAQDRNVSIQSSNPNQYVHAPLGNACERNSIMQDITKRSRIISSIRGRLFKYVNDTNHSLNFSEASSNIFSEIRKNVDTNLKKIAPAALEELSTAHNLVNSAKSTDWSNLASSCRRFFMQLADIVSPATNEEIETKDGKKVKLTKEKYRLRLKTFIVGQDPEDATARDTAEFVFELLDSVNRVCAKGDKKKIKKDTAEKIIIYSYLLAHEIVLRHMQGGTK